MQDDDSQQPVISFDAFRLFPKVRRLEKDGAAVHIGGRALDILIYLAEHPGEVVGKRELIKHVWTDVNVDDGSLRFHITALRKSLGAGDDGSRYVINVPGRGYCFASSVARTEPSRQSPVNDATRSLPAPLAKMIGRADAIQKISAELHHHRFVSIVGSGGIGKTSVAVAVGHDQLDTFGGQVFFVDFGALRDKGLVLQTIASVLGLKIGSADPLSGLLTHLHARRILLILDSCEHVIEVLTPLIERLVGQLPELHVLSTSRESFRAEQERIYRLFPLECPPQLEGLTIADVLSYPAAQLFIERVSDGLAEFQLSDEEAPLVAEICQRLDGIALAIELAAGRVHAYGIAGTASLLNSRFSLSWRGRRTSIPRHQTLSAAVGWSYELLPQVEAVTLRRLSVFEGPFTLESATAIASDSQISETDAIDAIANLLSKSLIATPSERPLRYRLLDTTRAFAKEKLVKSGEAGPSARSHAEYFRDFLRKVSVKSNDDRFVPHADQVPNVRAALDWSFSSLGDPIIGLDLAVPAVQFFLELSRLTECYHWTRRTMSLLENSSIGDRQEMELQAALGVSLMFTQGNSDAVKSAFARSLHLAEQVVDLHWQFWLLRTIHVYCTRIGDFRGTLEMSERGGAVAKALGDPAYTQYAEWMLGGAHHLLGNQDRAVRLSESAIAENPSSVRPSILRLGFDERILALAALARGLWLTGQPDRAVWAAKYSISEAEHLGQPLNLSLSLGLVIPVFLWAGDLTGAESLIDRFIDHTEKYSLGPHHDVSIGLKGELLVRRGNVAAGIDYLRRSQASLYAIRYRLMTTVLATALAEAHAQLGQFDEALRVIEEAIAQIGDDGESFDMPEMLRVKGHILACSGRVGEAENDLQQSLDLSRKQCALGWELRTAVTRGRLWKDGGRSAEARALIEPLYKRYHEGLETADLLNARHLLNSLN